MNPILLVDTWEDGGEIDEAYLFANGVSGMIVRLNDIDGGHHMDAGFAAQWEQARSFPVRIPYFVFNPWVSGHRNYDWLVANMPSEARAVMLDIEVAYSGITPDQYAAEVETFCSLVNLQWNSMIYTGEWFLPYLSTWPKSAGYWWAQYPFALYPSVKQPLSWGKLRDKLAAFSLPANASKVPGQLRMWQFTADRYIMDGCTRAMDVNAWLGTMDELLDFAGGSNVVPVETRPQLLSKRAYFDGLTISDYKAVKPRSVTYHVTEVDVDKVDGFFVSPRPDMRTYVPRYVEKFGLDFAINGDGWTNDPRTGAIILAGRAASNGAEYGAPGSEETIYISKDKKFSLTKPAQLHMAISFPNRIVVDGKIPPINKTNDDIRARSAFGWSQDQSKIVFVAVDGLDYWSKDGMNFPEVAQLLIDFGCWFGVMFDSGGSTTKGVRDGSEIKVVNIPCGEDAVAGFDVKMRRVANILGLRMKTSSIPEPPTLPTGEAMIYQILVPVKPRPQPSMYSVTARNNLEAGITFVSEVTREVTEKINDIFHTITWVQAPDNYWVPMTYKGVTHVAVTTVTPPVEPPPPTTEPKIVHVIETKVYDNGTIEETIDGNKVY